MNQIDKNHGPGRWAPASRGGTKSVGIRRTYTETFLPTVQENSINTMIGTAARNINAAEAILKARETILPVRDVKLR